MKKWLSKIPKEAWVTLALAHLVIVALGATGWDLDRFGKPGRALAYYGDLSGANEAYDFFAPGVTKQDRIRFDVEDRWGDSKTFTFASQASHEAEIRVGDIVDQFSLEDLDDDNREEESSTVPRSMAASLAGTVFGQQPEARKVTVRLEEMWPVSMQEYRQGKRANWNFVYQAQFVDESRKP